MVSNQIEHGVIIQMNYIGRNVRKDSDVVLIDARLRSLTLFSWLLFIHFTDVHFVHTHIEHLTNSILGICKIGWSQIARNVHTLSDGQVIAQNTQKFCASDDSTMHFTEKESEKEKKIRISYRLISSFHGNQKILTKNYPIEPFWR